MSSPQDRYPNPERRYPEPGSSADSGPLAGAFRDLAIGEWAAAERAFVAALAQGAESTGQSALSVIGVAQARLFGAMDARGAFAVLQSLFTQLTTLSPEVAVRLHTVAAQLFATPEPGVYDSNRSRAHAVAARAALTEAGGADQRALLAVAETWAALDLKRDVALVVSSAELHALVNAVGPMTRCLVLEALSFGALAEGDDDGEAAWLEAARVASCQIAFAACEARLLLRQALRCARRGERGTARLLRESAGSALTRAAAEQSWLKWALQEPSLEPGRGQDT